MRRAGALVVPVLIPFALGLGAQALAEDLEAAAAARTGDYATAISRWRTFADQGDGDSAFRLGQAFETGQGVGQNPAEAALWYRKAASLGNTSAALKMGALYQAGRGVPQDFEQADRWYRIAAGNGSGAAAYALGVMAENDERTDGTPRDLDAAIAWYRKALEAGEPDAQSRLAALGVAPRRPPPADPAPPRAAPQASAPQPRPALPDGTASFERAIAIWRERGFDAVSPAAIAALEAAAKSGHPLAEYDLAYAYEHGLGMPSDPARAYAWYKIAETSDGPARLREAAQTNRRLLDGRLSDQEKRAAEHIAMEQQARGPDGPVTLPAGKGSR
ncbi:MAG TPA: SEL1-like repeat protein [Aliidongia sp.]|nr:SEL1-like repeat protein [Aliidongia sp.]